jgi:hypothetical protein
MRQWVSFAISDFYVLCFICLPSLFV